MTTISWQAFHSIGELCWSLVAQNCMLTRNISANCEKQIVTPDHKVLFCSKECARQDRMSRTNSMASTDLSPPRTPISESRSFESLHRHPQIVQQRSPTSPYPSANRFSISSLSSVEYHQADDDTRPRVTRNPSDASRWLGSFHSSTDLQDMAEQATPRRPKAGRGHSAAPSLSHTPSTYSTTGTSFPYTPHSMKNLSQFHNGGPLPSRNNPYSLSYAAKSIDLVQPMTILSMTAPETNIDSLPRKSSPSTGTSAGTIVQGEILSYEKKSIDTLREKKDGLPPVSPSNGSLKQLFSFAAMQSSPSTPTSSTTRSPRASRAFLHTHHD